MTSGAITLRRLTPADFPLLGRWLREPHVARWWNHETAPEAVERDFGPSARGEEPNEDWLVLVDGEPVGLVQRCRWHDYPDYVTEIAPILTIPPDAMTIDYLLGDPARIGQGLGPRILRTVVADTWSRHPDAHSVVVPVVAANRRSWRALEKAGARRVASGEMKPDNPVDEPLHHVYRFDRPLVSGAVPMTARYATTCRVCSRPVSPGEEIARSAGGWGHAGCADAPAPAASTPGAPTPTAPAPKRAGRPDMPAAEGALEVWTDGACSGNPGPGGWAWATQDGRTGSGGAPATTNQRMEIQAALEAVRALPGPLVVVSDSTYVVNCFRDGWWRGWLARGWVTSARKPVANRDLWEPLVALVNERGDVSFRWVKGHSGDPMNDLVDRLAVEESARAAN